MYIHVIKLLKKETMNLKESSMSYMEMFEGKKVKTVLLNYNLKKILKSY